MHLIVQDQSETMEFMVITNKGLLYDFCNGAIFLHYVTLHYNCYVALFSCILDNNFLTKSDNWVGSNLFRSLK